jgi:hypothetical protein
VRELAGLALRVVQHDVGVLELLTCPGREGVPFPRWHRLNVHDSQRDGEGERVTQEIEADHGA